MSQSDDSPAQRYEGYTDYREVSTSVANSIDDAVDAYARVQSLHSEDARVQPQTGAEASARILSAALKLLPELEADSHLENVSYHEILARWKGEDGYVARLKQTSLTADCPEWMHQFVVDLRQAGWELGYLKAGRETDAEDVDWKDADVEEMFE